MRVGRRPGRKDLVRSVGYHLGFRMLYICRFAINDSSPEDLDGRQAGHDISSSQASMLNYLRAVGHMNPGIKSFNHNESRIEQCEGLAKRLSMQQTCETEHCPEYVEDLPHDDQATSDMSRDRFCWAA